MMESMMSFITWKPTRILLWIILSTFFLKQVLFPLIISKSLHLWTLIKHSKFMYIIINFIIISILISSTSFTPLFTKLYLKLHKTICTSNNYNSSLQNHYDDDDHQANDDQDVWWFFSLSQMDNEPVTAPFGVQEVDKHCNDTNKIIDQDILDLNPIKTVVSSARDEDTWWFFSLPEMDHRSSDEETSRCRVLDEEVNNNNNNNNPVLSHGYGVEDIDVEEKRLGEEEDSLDATWKAIMESKGKESGPQLKKSDTWSAGDGRVEEKRKGVIGGLSKYKVTVQLKKWQSFRNMIERRESFSGGSEAGGGGGDGDGSDCGKRGWKSVDMALTFHDELKKRADAFIDNFTHSIRLQRLESNQRFMEMINRGH